MDQTTPARRDDTGLLLGWGPVVVGLVLLGLLLSARAGDDYTMVVGLLLAGFGVLIGFRIAGRLLP